MEWLDVTIRRGVRERTAPHAPPDALGLLALELTELLRLWVRKDHASRGREALLKESGRQRIELADALSEWLLREGWITRKEKLIGGVWQWDSLTWRDLDTLKQLLGVGSRSLRDEERGRLMASLRTWRQSLPDPAEADWMQRLQGGLDAALDGLADESVVRVDVLQARSRWLMALCRWVQEERQGTRRDFALMAADHTKGIGQTDWQWLQAHFDLDSLGISAFSPVLWLAGSVRLQWSQGQLNLSPAGFVGLPLDAVMQVVALSGLPKHWWLIENRTSFERQSQQLDADTLLVWMPGRASPAWVSALLHLVRLAPAPLRISADADPSGVDMAMSMGRQWAAMGCDWVPYRMGATELMAARQSWPLNSHDLGLLDRLLADTDMPQALRELCQAMQDGGLKAEQEGWL